MTQQINLLNPALIKKTDFLNPNNIGLLLGILLLAIVGYYAFAQMTLGKIKLQREQVATSLTATQGQLNQMLELQKNSSNNQTLLNEIKQLEEKVNMQEAILKAVGSKTSDVQTSYADIFRAFSKQSIDGLWITALSIDQDAQALSISGRAVNADLVPKLIDRLRAEPVLKGKSFSTLNMAAPAKSVNESTAINSLQAPVAPQAVSLTNEIAKVSLTQANSQAIQLQNESSQSKPQYIEFTLFSNNKVTTDNSKLTENNLTVSAH